jgi:uncharacterized RDD family membrane protein YckC
MAHDLPDPDTAPELFDNILTRRVLAYFVDVVIISFLGGMVLLTTLLVGLLTLGLGWLTLPIVLPLTVLAYYAVTLGSPSRATIGMRIFDIILTPTQGTPLDGWKVLIHPFVFWLTIWIFWPLLFIGLFTARRQLVHDLLTSTMMVRRSPMERHWSNADFAGGAY